MTDHAPYQPTARQLFWFWLAPVLTCLFFIPALLAGIFGAPSMILGTLLGWLHLRSGHDSFSTFALSGFCVGLFSLFAALLIAPESGAIFLFGLLFGPLMAMTFRIISGRWRP